MKGQPSNFESLVTHLGFQTHEESEDQLSLVWRGTRFPGYLCLGVSLALLFLSVPVMEAIRIRGLGSTAASLWYFPVMNLILFCVAVFLLSLKRVIIIDQRSQQVYLYRKSLLRRRDLEVDFSEIENLRLGTDMVYSGPALAGSTTGQSFFPASALRLVLTSGETVLMDRGSKRRIEDLARRLSRFLCKPTTSE
ncbi:MAG: hypothetical protein ACE5E2_04980 [Candidatus Binatia bacterium]